MATLKTFQHLIPDALCYLALVWVISVVLILAQILIILFLCSIMAVGLFGSVNPDLPAELISGSGRLLLYSALVTRPWLVVIAVVQRMAVQWLENRTGQRDKIAQTAISVTLAGIAGTVYVFEGATSTPHPSRFFTTTSDDLYGYALPVTIALLIGPKVLQRIYKHFTVLPAH